MPRKTAKSSIPEPLPLSKQLETWLHGNQPKTLDTLISTFGDRSFAVIMALFMLLPALPVPTAAHPLEAVVVLVAAQQILGLRSLWFPKFLSSRINLQKVAKSKAMDKTLLRLRWLERKSNPRGRWVFSLPLFSRAIGLVVIIFTLAAFFAPPFSLLDTLPAIGVVLIGLAILLEDVILLSIGVVLGTVGVGLTVFLGTQIEHFMRVHIFHKS